jgi:hypothetical protein
LDADVLTFSDRLDLDPVARGLWEALMPHLRAALSGEDGEFLDALGRAARSAALSGVTPVAALLEAYNEGSCQLCRVLDEAAAAQGPAPNSLDAGEARLCLQALEKTALARVATGYCGGLEETVATLRRAAEEVSPLDSATGALKPRETLSRMRLEAERCRRVEAPLGLIAFSVPTHRPVSRTARLPVVQETARRLREGLRRYDSLGLSAQGDLVVVMPDVSRRGLVAAAERLRDEVTRPCGRKEAPEVLCAFFHYDEADVDAAAMLAALEQGLDEARFARRMAAS